MVRRYIWEHFGGQNFWSGIAHNENLNHFFIKFVSEIIVGGISVSFDFSNLRLKYIYTSNTHIVQYNVKRDFSVITVHLSHDVTRTVIQYSVSIFLLVLHTLQLRQNKLRQCSNLNSANSSGKKRFLFT